MQETRRGRSGWLGFAFLGLAVVLTIGTLFLALTDRSLADFGIFSDNDQSFDEEFQAGSSATLTAISSITPTPTPDSALMQIPQDLEVTASSVFVIRPGTNQVLFERNADQPLQPASTAKIFTAMVVLEHASPDEVVTIIEDDVVDPVRESSMGLQAGDRVTINDLLVGLMLPSGNDAANALARTIGERIEGDEATLAEDRFIADMNRLAGELGLETSTLKNAAGLDRDGQVVTARELAIAAEALLERPSLMAIVAMTNAEIRIGGANARIISVGNTNEMLVHEGVYGVKTGTTGEAGQCMVVAYRDGDVTVIAVLLNSEDRYGDSRALLSLPEPPEPIDDEHPEPVEDPTEPDESPQG